MLPYVTMGHMQRPKGTWSTLRVRRRTIDELVKLEEHLARKGIEALPRDLRPIMAEGVSRGALVYAAVLALRRSLLR